MSQTRSCQILVLQVQCTIVSSHGARGVDNWLVPNLDETLCTVDNTYCTTDSTQWKMAFSVLHVFALVL